MRLLAWLIVVVLWAAPLAGCAVRTPKAVTGATWPTPKGWKHERLAIPLSFAPEMGHKGVEELRFPPGFSDPASGSYWSYTFAWFFEDDADINANTLETDLARYFGGLSKELGRGRFGFDPGHFRAELSQQLVQRELTGSSEWGLRGFRGSVDTYDAMTTGKEMVLNADVQTWRCGSAARHVVLVAVSPRGFNDEIWRDLHSMMSLFECK